MELSSGNLNKPTKTCNRLLDSRPYLPSHASLGRLRIHDNWSSQVGIRA